MAALPPLTSPAVASHTASPLAPKRVTQNWNNFFAAAK